MLGGEFNSVGASAGGDVDLQATGDADLVGTIATIDGNRSKAKTAAAQVGFSCARTSNSDLIIAVAALGSDISASIGIICMSAD